MISALGAALGRSASSWLRFCSSTGRLIEVTADSSGSSKSAATKRSGCRSAPVSDGWPRGSPLVVASSASGPTTHPTRTSNYSCTEVAAESSASPTRCSTLGDEHPLPGPAAPRPHDAGLRQPARAGGAHRNGATPLVRRRFWWTVGPFRTIGVGCGAERPAGSWRRRRGEGGRDQVRGLGDVRTEIVSGHTASGSG